MKQKIESWSDVEPGTILYRLPIHIPLDHGAQFIVPFNKILSEAEQVQWVVCKGELFQNTVYANEAKVVLNKGERMFKIAKNHANSFFYLIFVRNKVERAIKYGNEYFTYGYDKDKFAEDEDGHIFTYDYDEFVRLAKAMTKEYEKFLRDEQKLTRKIFFDIQKKKRNT